VLHTRKQKEMITENYNKKTVEQYSIYEHSPVDVRWTVGGWERHHTYGGKDFKKRCALSLEWKRVGVMDGESGDDGAGRPR